MTYANAAELTVKRSQCDTDGADIASLQSPDGTNGNKFKNNPGKTMVRLKNTNAATRTVTFETPGTIRGLAIGDLAVVVPANTGDILVGPFPPEFHQPGTSDIFMSYSAVTNLTVDVIEPGSLP